MAHQLEILSVGGKLLASFAVAWDGMTTQALWWRGQDGGIQPRAEYQTRQRASVMLQASGIATMRVAMRPLYSLRADGSAVESTMRRELYRVDTDAPLSTAGMRAEYCPSPGDTVRACLAGMVASGDATDEDPYIQTCGILDGGGSIFAQGAVAREIDLGRGSVAQVKPFIAINHSQRSDRLGVSVTDVVCANTLAVAWKDAESMGLAFDSPGKRSATYEARLKSYAKSFGKVLEATERLGKAARVAKEMPMDGQQRKAAIAEILANDPSEMTAQEENKVSQVLTLTDGHGLIGTESHNEGSAWSVVAAITQWADRAMHRHYDAHEENDSGLRNANTFIGSALGFTDRAQDVRSAAHDWLFQTVGA